jgi:CHASE3 domain sensor protein
MFRDSLEDVLDFFLPVLATFLIAIAVAIPIVAVVYFSSCKQANVYNEKNGTEYTCGDFFWASDQINSQIQTIKVEGIN